MRTARVRDRSEFAALAQRGRRARRQAVRVTFLSSSGLSTAAVGDTEVRVAFAIPRAVGTAVVRNRIRRRLRAALGELDAAPGSYLVSATPGAAALSYDELRRDLGGCLEDLAARR